MAVYNLNTLGPDAMKGPVAARPRRSCCGVTLLHAVLAVALLQLLLLAGVAVLAVSMSQIAGTLSSVSRDGISPALSSSLSSMLSDTMEKAAVSATSDGSQFSEATEDLSLKMTTALGNTLVDRVQSILENGVSPEVSAMLASTLSLGVNKTVESMLDGFMKVPLTMIKSAVVGSVPGAVDTALGLDYSALANQFVTITNFAQRGATALVTNGIVKADDAAPTQTMIAAIRSVGIAVAQVNGHPSARAGHEKAGTTPSAPNRVLGGRATKTAERSATTTTTTPKTTTTTTTPPTPRNTTTTTTTTLPPGNTTTTTDPRTTTTTTRPQTTSTTLLPAADSEVESDLLRFVLDVMNGLRRDFAPQTWAAKAAACDDLYNRVTSVPWVETYSSTCTIQPWAQEASCNCPIGMVYKSSDGCEAAGTSCTCIWSAGVDVLQYAGYAQEICHALGQA